MRRVMTPRFRSLWAVALAVGFGTSVVAGCQETEKVGVENQCTEPIEADMDDVADPEGLGYKIEWTVIEPGQFRMLRSASSPLRTQYVWVRSPGSAATPSPLSVRPEDIGKSSDGNGKSVVVISGAGCP